MFTARCDSVTLAIGQFHRCQAQTTLKLDYIPAIFLYRLYLTSFGSLTVRFETHALLSQIKPVADYPMPCGRP